MELGAIEPRMSEEIVSVPCKLIVPRPDNRPIDAGIVEEIAETFEQTEQTTPIIVRKLMGGRYELIDGHHRLAAKNRAALKHPGNPSHAYIACIVRDLTDAEAEIQMAVANIHKPLSVAEKGRLYERIGLRVDELREADPALFQGMDRGEAIASCASSAAGSVSKATVYRSINEAHAEDGTHEYAGMTPKQRKLVSRMKSGQRKEAQRVLESDGQEGLDAWLKKLAVDDAQEDVKKCCMRIRSSCAEIRRYEKGGCVLDRSTASLVDAIERACSDKTWR